MALASGAVGAVRPGVAAVSRRSVQRATRRVATQAMADRRPMISGNWKENPATIKEAADLAGAIAGGNKGAAGKSDVCCFPPFPFIPLVADKFAGTDVKVGAQNMSLENGGAYTGEVSAAMIKSLGCEYVLLGHSERRTLYGESDAQINQKVLNALGHGLKVTLCVGETLEEYESGLVNSVCEVQLKKGLVGVDAAAAVNVVIAYEPVWAIGTGLSATPEIAQTVHAQIRAVLATIWGADVAAKVLIQYGGSVNPENVDALMAMPDIDGALVGGASLKADSFDRLVHFN